MRRRDVLTGLIGGAAATILPGSTGAAEIASLGETAKAAGVAFGCSFDRQTIGDPAYARLTTTHARILTTDWSMKFAALRGDGPTADFTWADRLVAFAEAAKIPVRGHTLCWNNGNPLWLKKLSRERRAYWLDRHITEVMDHYYGRMHSWDVVNEPFWPEAGGDGGWATGPWWDALGKGWVAAAFARAHRVDPNVKLVLNEAWTEAATPRGLAIRASLLRMVDELKDKGLRLDAVGLQAHIRPKETFDPDGWRRFLADLAARDVEIYITELDVDDRIFSGSDAERDEQVGKTYRRVLDVALDEPKVTAIITWQLADPFSFYVDEYGKNTRPLPFDAELKPKPAYHAMLAAFRAHRRG